MQPVTNQECMQAFQFDPTGDRLEIVEDSDQPEDQEEGDRSEDEDDGGQWEDEEESDQSDGEDEKEESFNEVVAEMEAESGPACLKDFPLMGQLCEGLSAIMIEHDVSERGADKMWDYVGNNLTLINAAHQEYGGFPNYRTLQRKAREKIPNVKIKATWMDQDTREEVTARDLLKLPKAPDKYRLICETSSVSVADVIANHSHHATSLHALTSNEVILSMDGVQENNTSGLSITVVSLRFRHCRQVYPIVIYRPNVLRRKVDYTRVLLWPVVEECISQGLKVGLIIADAPMRAVIKMLVNHSGYYCCDYCERPGDSASETGCKGIKWLPEENPDKRPGQRLLVEHTLRTGERSKHYALLAQQLREEDRFHTRHTKGMQGYSPLHNLEGFDIVRNIPTDYMHLICLGVYKKTFLEGVLEGARSGYLRSRTKEALVAMQDAIWRVKVPSEFSRRGRDLTLKYTAEEYRNLCIFLFPIVVQHTRDEEQKEILLRMAYIVRAYLEDDFAFRPRLSSGSLRDLLDEFYWRYYEVFGKEMCTYNLHVMSHLDILREKAPLTETSAFLFERSYGGLKFFNRHAKMSKGKRGLEKVLMRATVGHSCKKTLKYRDQSTSRSDDTLIYTEVLPGMHEFYCLKKKDVDKDGRTCKGQHLACKIRTGSYTVILREGQHNLNMSDVGAYQYLEEEEDSFYIQEHKIRGKAIRVEKYIITVPMNVLLET